MQKQGHDGIIITRATTDTGMPRKDYVVFEPKNIRSRFAMFDPKKSESGDILANIAGATTIGALAGLEIDIMAKTSIKKWQMQKLEPLKNI